jgi:hypothetical protein
VNSTQLSENLKTEAGQTPGFRFFFCSLGSGAPAFLLAAALTTWVFCTSGCAIFTQRPAQEMSDTTAAIRAAREVQADTLAPELFRQASEWYFKAKNDYKYKNFKAAKDELLKARAYAEKAEFEASRNGAARTEVTAPDPMNNLPGGAPPPPPTPSYTPYDYATPTGIPAEDYDQRKKEEEQRSQQQNSTGQTHQTTPNQPTNVGPLPTP